MHQAVNKTHLQLTIIDLHTSHESKNLTADQRAIPFLLDSHKGHWKQIFHTLVIKKLAFSCWIFVSYSVYE